MTITSDTMLSKADTTITISAVVAVLLLLALLLCCCFCVGCTCYWRNERAHKTNDNSNARQSTSVEDGSVQNKVLMIEDSVPWGHPHRNPPNE